MPSLSPFPYIQPSVDQSIRQQLIESSRREYGRLYDLLAFASPEQFAAPRQSGMNCCSGLINTPLSAMPEPR